MNRYTNTNEHTLMTLQITKMGNWEYDNVLQTVPLQDHTHKGTKIK